VPRWKDTDLAYFAGLFDGEGCIEVNVRHRTGYTFEERRSYRVGFSLWNSDRDVLEWVEATFGGIIYEQTRRNRKRPYYSWRGGLKSYRELFTAARPYMRIKGPQLDLALELLDLAIPRGYRARVPTENEHRRLEIIKEVRALKDKGLDKEAA
jgi:hypothetical protein